MKKLCLCGFAFAAFAAFAGGSALAADLPAKAPVYKAPAAVAISDPWTGVYLGGNVGYSWGPFDSSSNQIIFATRSATASPKVNGFLGGLQAGYNWRANPQWVWGIEADAQLTGEKRTETWSDPELPPTAVVVIGDFVPRPGGPATLTSQWELPWFATFRLRAGFTPAENWLFYVTGGLAVGQTRYSFNFSQPGAAANAPPGPTNTRTTYALATSSTRAGYAVGAGTEVKIGGNWSAKFEYLFVDLGSVAIDTVDIDGAPFHVGYRARDHIARVGLNYKLGN
jgi:outer membrane immunogenic protein